MMSDNDVYLVELLESAVPEERLPLLNSYLSELISDILALSSDDELDVNATFTDIGLDSITAVTLKSQISKNIGGSFVFETTDVFDHPTINKLSQYIGTQLKLDGFAVADESAESVEKADSLEAQAQKEVDELSEEDILKGLEDKLEDD